MLKIGQIRVSQYPTVFQLNSATIPTHNKNHILYLVETFPAPLLHHPPLYSAIFTNCPSSTMWYKEAVVSRRVVWKLLPPPTLYLFRNSINTFEYRLFCLICSHLALSLILRTVLVFFWSFYITTLPFQMHHCLLSTPVDDLLFTVHTRSLCTHTVIFEVFPQSLS